MRRPCPYLLSVSCRDTVSEATQDRIEAIVAGRILSHRDDGTGRMALAVQPRVRPDRKRRKAILEAIQGMGLKAHWLGG